MLGDVFNAVGQLAVLLGIGILIFSTYRAVEIVRVLVKGIYRTRAVWTAAVMVVIIFFSLANLLPNDTSGVVGFLSTLSFGVTAIVLFAFVDSSIMVAQEMDFFHRSTLGWQRFRKPFYVLVITSAVVSLWGIYLGGYFDTLAGTLAIAQVFAVIGILFTYSAIALTVGARRTPDRTMRRFVRMLGLAILCVAIYFTIWIPFNVVPHLGDMISDFFATAGIYFLFLSVRSLSPVSHVETEYTPVPQAGEGDPLVRA
jgi:hypothetical protein